MRGALTLLRICQISILYSRGRWEDMLLWSQAPSCLWGDTDDDILKHQRPSIAHNHQRQNGYNYYNRQKLGWQQRANRTLGHYKQDKLSRQGGQSLAYTNENGQELMSSCYMKKSWSLFQFPDLRPVFQFQSSSIEGEFRTLNKDPAIPQKIYMIRIAKILSQKQYTATS